MIEEQDFSKFQPSEEALNKISENAKSLFKVLLNDDYKIDSREDLVVVLNSALCFMCMIQNTFYPYEHRDDFASSVADAMKKNKGPEPVADTSVKAIYIDPSTELSEPIV